MEKIEGRQVTPAPSQFFKGMTSNNMNGRPVGARSRFMRDTKTQMRNIIRRAMKGTTGELEDRLFEDMTLRERWQIINGWMKFIMTTHVENKISGDIQVEVSWDKKKPKTYDEEIADEDQRLDTGVDLNSYYEGEKLNDEAVDLLDGDD